MDDELEELADFGLELLLGHNTLNYRYKKAAAQAGPDLPPKPRTPRSESK